jgi:hypothetical protein
MTRPMMTAAQHSTRANIRNFLLTATMAELVREKQISLEGGDLFRAACVQELIDEG